MKTVFVVDLATPKLAEAIHKAGYQAGALVLWHDRVTPSSWAIKSAGYDVELRMSTKDPLDTIEAVLRQAAPDIAGIIPTNEPSEEVACRLAQRFNLPHNSPEIAAIRWNKAKVKELAQKAGLRVPKFKECYSEKDVRDFAKELSYPIIIKPPAGAASINVFKCHTLNELLEKHQTIISTPDDFNNRPDYSVVEEYIAGTEYQINTFSDGKNVRVTDIWLTEKIDTEFASNLYYNSWVVDPADPKAESIAAYAVKVTRANGIKYGPGYIQLKADEKGPALIEIHARFGGGGLPEIVKFVSNFDPIKATVAVFTKGSTIIPEKMKFSSHFAIVACPSVWNCERGQLKGIEEIRRLPTYCGSYPKEETQLSPVRPTTTLRNNPFVVWLSGNDQDQLHKDMQRVHELFHIICY